MIQDEELREEWIQEMLQESREEELTERRLHEDLEYCLDWFGIDSDMSLIELDKYTVTLKEYGHDVSICDLVKEIL